MGAAIQAAILGGEEEVKDVLLLDVTPLTLGIETLGGVMTPLIERNTTIPAEKSQVFSTASDNQSSVEIHVLQGERPMAKDNRTLGRFILDGLPPASRGVPQIEVKFDLDANGILTVSALDKASNKEQHITIKDSSALSDKEIEKMKKEAEKFATEDRKEKEMIEARNQADNLIFISEKSLKDAGDKIKKEEKEDIEKKIEALKKAKDSQTLEEIKKASEELSTAIQKIGEAMYQQGTESQGQNQASGPASSEKNNSKKDSGSSDKKDEPLEGEIEEDEQKK
jgi:molecular chaperone DnaK